MMTIDKTQGQLARQARDREIVRKFRAIRERYPDVSLERIFVTIAKDYPIGKGAVRVICKREGLC